MQLIHCAVHHAQQPIVHHCSFQLNPGSVQLLMGSNGSGKSSLAHAIMGYPPYVISSGSLVVDGQDIADLALNKRAQLGIFLAFQHPQAIPGVRVSALLAAAYSALHGHIDPKVLQERVYGYMDLLQMDRALYYRDMHDGFSGGQRKKLELLQLLVLRPRYAILDEIDSGLDVDAVAVAARALQVARQENPALALLIITHYRHIIAHIVPDTLHIMQEGRLVYSGSVELLDTIEQHGFQGLQL